MPLVLQIVLPGIFTLIAALIVGQYAIIQIRNNNITNARIKWLENLKNFISQFAACSSDLILSVQISHYKAAYENQEKNISDLNWEHEKRVINLITSLYTNLHLIILNLNPKEDSHIKLKDKLNAHYKLLTDFIKTYGNLTNDKGEKISEMEYINKVDEKILEIILLSRYIMKIEWEKVKRSESDFNDYINFGKGKEFMEDLKKM